MDLDVLILLLLLMTLLALDVDVDPSGTHRVIIILALLALDLDQQLSGTHRDLIIVLPLFALDLDLALAHGLPVTCDLSYLINLQGILQPVYLEARLRMLRRHHHYHLLSSLTQRSFHCFQKTGGSTCQSDGRLGSDYCTGRAPGWICFHVGN